MLKCYLDDSGTHDSSRVLVWGGVAGHKGFFDEFDAGWKARLKAPCDRKPAIKVFHSYDLARGKGEFADYNQAERDLTRWNFRKVLADAGLTWLSYGISLEAWEKVVPEDVRQHFTAESFVFGAVVRDICKSAKEFGDPVTFQFDKGRSSPDLISMIQPALESSKAKDSFADYSFSPVAANTGLQAADLVAHETYQFLNKYLDNFDTKASPHLQRLQEEAFDAKCGFFGEREIQQAFDELALADTLVQRGDNMRYTVASKEG